MFKKTEKQITPTMSDFPKMKTNSTRVSDTTTKKTFTVGKVKQTQIQTQMQTQMQNTHVANQSMNFIEKVKIEKINNTITNANKLKPGWIEIYKDKDTNKIMYNENIISLPDYNSSNTVLQSLVDLHTKRKNTFIDYWGEDAYDNMFVSPNYDSTYFDELDNQYENQKNNEISSSSSSDDDFDDC
jgi:hypothetical protein